MPKLPSTRLGKLRLVLLLFIGFLGIVFLSDVALTRSSLSKAQLLSIYNGYYANVPISDPIVVSVSGFAMPYLPWNTMVSDSLGTKLSVVYVKAAKQLVIRPAEGYWPRSQTIRLNIKPPRSILHDRISGLVAKMGIPELLGKELVFTTAGKFTVLSSTMPQDPRYVGTLRFSYKVKYPDQLSEYIRIEPDVPFTVVPQQSATFQEHGTVFTINIPELEYSKNYTITVLPELESELGEFLTEPFAKTFTTIANPNLPSLLFGSNRKNWRLINGSPQKALDIPLTVEKTDTAAVSVYRISIAEAINYFSYSSDSDEVWNIWQRKPLTTIDTKNKPVLWSNPAKGGYQILSLPQLTTGTYVIEATAEERGNIIRQQSIINISSYAASAVVGKTNAVYFVSDAQTGEAIGGASIRLYRLKDGASILSDNTTTEQGMVEIPNTAAVDLGVAFVDDEAILLPVNLSETSLRPLSKNNYWYTQYPLATAPTIRGYITTDRPLYKPGDTVQAKVVVRNDDDAAYTIPDGKEFTLQLSKSNWSNDARPIVEEQVTLTEFGTAASTFTIPEDDIAEVLYIVLKHDGKIIAAQPITVSAYRKPLYHLTATTDKTTYVSGDTIQVSITGETSFGSILADKTVTWYVKPVKRYYSDENGNDPYSKNNSYMYTSTYGWFDYNNVFWAKSVKSGTAVLNAEGKADISIDLDSGLIPDRSDVYIQVTVEDEAKTPETEQIAVTYAPSNYQLKAIASHTTREAPGVTVKVTDEKGKPVSGVEINIQESRETKPVEASIITNDQGEARVQYPPATAKYVSYSPTLVWKDAQGRQESQAVYVWAYASGYFLNQYSENDPLEPVLESSTVSIPSDVTLGQTYPVSVQGGGKDHLLIYSRESIHEARVVGDGESTSMLVTPEWYPNGELFTVSFKDGKIYSSVTAITPTDLPDYQAVKLSVISDKATYLPGETAIFTISTTDAKGNPIAAEVLLNAVDRSIYDLKSSSELPIHPFFYYRRYNRSVFSASSFGLFSYVFGGGGGGGGGDSPIRDNFADTAFFLPFVRTNDQGKAQVSVTLPDTLTTWILSSYAVTRDTKVGQATAEFVTAKPLAVFPNAPTFLVAGDQVNIEATIRNTTDTQQTISVSAALDDQEPEKNPTQQLTVSSQDGATVSWPFSVTKEQGQSTLAILSQAGDAYRDGVAVPISILPNQTTIETKQSGIDGTTITPVLLQEANPSRSSGVLHLAGGITGSLLDVIVYQAGYPYGCIEQTMSRFYPSVLMLAFDSSLRSAYADRFSKLDDMVTKGLQRVAYLQHEDGGWGYWERDTSTVFNTSYVLSALQTLKKSYTVPSTLVPSATRYLESRLKTGSLSTEDKIVSFGTMIELNNPWVATLSAQLAPSAMKIDDLDDEQVARLAYSFARLDKPEADTYIAELEKRAIHHEDGTISWKKGDKGRYSYAHANLSTALALKALLTYNPKHEMIANIVQYLNTYKSIQMYGSTYTNAQVTEALLSYAKQRNEANPALTVTVSQDGNTLYTQTITDQSFTTSVPVGVTGPIHISTSGTGVLLWDYTISNIVPSLPNGRESESFKLTRTYTNLTRKDGTYRPGDIVNVELAYTNKTSNYIYNLVLEDPIPAGFEIINQSFENEQANYGSSSTSWYRKNIYNDKVVLFPWSISGNGYRKATYVARVVHSGTFTALAPHIQGMYEDTQPAYGATETITILPLEK